MVQKRLFIGGLFPGVNEDELRQRFSSYGSVSDIEIKTKKDESGNLVKTFAYMDIEAPDSDLQKCFRTYNKSKWKGSELSLQFAKENFVKRLETERKDGDTTQTPSPSKLKKGPKPMVTEVPGIKEFDVKGAVPGTSIQDQKDWVVGKYGRVLPVVTVRSKDKRKLLKVDPSKYTHNVKRMKDDQLHETDTVNTSELTWKLEDDNNDLTKKRKGEFPNWTPVKRKPEPVESSSDDDMQIVPIIDPNNSRQVNSSESGKSRIKSSGSGKHMSPSVSLKTSDKNELQKNKVTKVIGKNGFSDDGYDSGDTDEIIAVSKKHYSNSNSAKQNKTTSTLKINPLQEKLVALSMTKYITSRTGETSNEKIKEKTIGKDNKGKKHDKDLNKPGTLGSGSSAYTNVEETTLTEFRGTKFLDDDCDVRTAAEEIDDKRNGIKIRGKGKDTHVPDLEADSEEMTVVSKRHSSKQDTCTKSDLQSNSVSNGKQSETGIKINPLQEKLLALSQTESSHSKKNSNKNFKFKTVETEHMKKQGAKRSNQFKTESPSMEFRGTGYLDDDSGIKSVGAEVSNKNSSQNRHKSEDIASDSDSDFESLVRKEMGKTLNSRQNATKTLTKYRDSTTEKTDDESGDDDKNSVSSAGTDEILSSSISSKQKKIDESNRKVQKLFHSFHSSGFDEYSSGLKPGSDTAENSQYSTSENKSSSEGSEEESDFETLVKKELIKYKQQIKKKQAKSSSKKFNKDWGINSVDMKESDIATKDSHKLSFVLKNAADVKNTVGEDEITKTDDKKRREAVKQRQKEHLAQKTLIQKALSNLDEDVRSNKRIVFDSDDDVDDTLEHEQVREHDHSGNNFEMEPTERSEVKVKKTKGVGLFDDSSDEDGDEKQDQHMFNLRPEFEGSAGKKLMSLQSRYGNDERFKLDTRFAESDSETEEKKVAEDDEKTKQLKILASVLGSSAGIVLDKTDKAKKTFKDVSQLQFDPIRNEHSQLEIKITRKPRPEKAEKKRKKKSAAKEAEAETDAQPMLPEVSKERFFEVSESIKDAFKKNEESEPKGFSLLAAFGRKDSDSEEEIDEEVTVKPFTSIMDPLTLDSRFKVDGSDSEHEESHAIPIDWESNEPQKSIFEKTVPDFVQPRTFFFTEDDPRLRAGEKFYRTEDMETVREKWLKQRPQLIESYRSKHKRFRRKLRIMQKSKRGVGKKYKRS